MKIPTKSPKQIFRRRRCDNCFALFAPAKQEQRFCKKACRYEFHKHGSAFGPLKIKLEKLCLKTISLETAKLRSELSALAEQIRDLQVMRTPKTAAVSDPQK